jgi:ActR/RegA family two-component response regulator
MTDAAIGSFPTERSLLIVDDDKLLLQALARAMEGRGLR